MKKFLILLLFVIVFSLCWVAVYYTKNNTSPAIEPQVSHTDVKTISDNMHTYSAQDITSGCSQEDNIFCAIEHTIKCTLAPDLDGCTKDVVPSFVLGKTEEGIRPTEISFQITKIKPIPESNDIAVYTNSDCNASWFGLCKGNVIYSLSKKDNNWVVANIYALEQ